MEIEFHPEAWPQLYRKSAVGVDALSLLDWQGLRARLSAAHALRRESYAMTQPTSLVPASFDTSAAQALSALCDGLPSVNPSISVNGKALAGKEINSSGALLPVDRGI